MKAVSSRVQLMNCQLSNALNNCLYVEGGDVQLNGCTIAQFYPFDALRGTALNVAGSNAAVSVSNSLITGYHDCEVETADGISVNYSHSVVRQEGASDLGDQHFRLIDTDNLQYDFHLSDVSTAIGVADAATSMTVDRDGLQRCSTPAAGCYEHLSEVE